ncbi:hypothetical protein A1QO_04200 [Vibrio genomosp. F10 str. ZF-129]|uniref:Uncharacterized protein n=1 Tax=Vibrio genomosp. F10 str. ZF-129 TaxID=1187848 RepID=A0A1E5BIQ1_9VIBR|nr:hypothetical protein [Vibrio genomosp. F10]OEE37314.1 hypothetical protein A1QO_04200 [Vibrio genomosp. F10 str. ZF-129]
MKISALYTSYWSEGTAIVTNCSIDLSTAITASGNLTNTGIHLTDLEVSDEEPNQSELLEREVVELKIGSHWSEFDCEQSDLTLDSKKKLACWFHDIGMTFPKKINHPYSNVGFNELIRHSPFGKGRITALGVTFDDFYVESSSMKTHVCESCMESESQLKSYFERGFETLEDCQCGVLGCNSKDETVLNIVLPNHTFPNWLTKSIKHNGEVYRVVGDLCDSHVQILVSNITWTPIEDIPVEVLEYQTSLQPGDLINMV